MRQAVRLRWSVTRLVSASPEGAAVFARGQSLCVRELGLGGRFPVQVLVGSPYSTGDGWCVCVCVCVFSKTWGERTQLRHKLEFQLESEMETCVRGSSWLLSEA